MTYTFLQLKTAVEHALGAAPDDRITSGLIVNRAIEYLSGFAPWGWRTTIASLATVNSQAYIALPSDFGELLQVSNGTSGAFQHIRKSGPYELLKARGSTYSTSGTLSYMLAISPAASTSSAPAWRLEIAPTPGSASGQANALAIAYKKLTPSTFALTGTADDAKVAEIPEGQQDTLYALCRAFAVSTEEQQTGHDWELAKELLARDLAADQRAGASQAGVDESGSDGQYTFGQLKSEVEAVVGRELAEKINSARVVNRAIEHVANAAPWTWRIILADLAVTISQSYIDLPADFGEMVGISKNAGTYTYIKNVGPSELLDLRKQTAGTMLGYMLGNSAQASATARPLRRLEIAPTPAATLASALTVCYRKVIPAFANSGTADDAKVPSIPVGMQDTLLSVVRATAAQVGGLATAGAEWEAANAKIALATAADARTAPEYVGADTGGTSGGYTFRQLKGEVEQSAGFDPTRRLAPASIVNRAIEYYSSRHSWSWRTVTTTLNFVALAETITLPADFGELIAIYGNAATYTAVRPVTETELLGLLVHGVTDSTFLGYCLGMQVQAAGNTTRPQRVLKIAPAPASNLTDALSLVYRMVVPTYALSGTADDAKTPPIPAGGQGALLALIRAFSAQAFNPKAFATEWAIAQELLKVEIAADTKAMPVRRGRIRNSPVDEYMQDGAPWQPFDVIRMANDP